MRAWKKLEDKLSRVKGAHVKVGILASKGGNEDRDGISMVELAAIHEFGSPAAGVPERSFIRRTVAEKQDLIAKLTAKLAKRVVEKNFPIAQALGVLGTVVAAEIKKTVTVGAGVPPKNAPSTIARKGSDRPLIDTGRMIDAVSHEVVA